MHDSHITEAEPSLRQTAANATLHCLTGCAIGEILGLVIGTAAGLSTRETIVLAVALAFCFGYVLSLLPVLRAGLPLPAALRLVIAADTLSIATMEIVDNTVMAVIPGAMEAGLLNPVFWIGMAIALTAAYLAAYPVNVLLLTRGKGHALTHDLHHGPSAQEPIGWRRRIPSLRTGTLVAAIASFLLGGLTVALAEELTGDQAHEGESLPAVTRLT